MIFLILPLFGALAGTFAGLFGTGGGLIYVPVMLALLPHFFGIPDPSVMHVAITTSLSIILVSSLASIRAHHTHGGILWPTVFHIGPGLILGAITGTLSAHFISGNLLQKIFAIFALLISLKMLIHWQPKIGHKGLPKRRGLTLFGFFLGNYSAMLGVGGGALSVPFFQVCRIPLSQAIATSAALTFPAALTAMIAAMLTGLNATGLPPWSTGYLYWPAFLGLMPTAVLCAPLGARLAHHLPTKILRYAFAIYLIFVAFDMWFTH